MAWHTVQETLKLTGKSRSQLYRDMAKGLVSYRTGKNDRRECNDERHTKPAVHKDGMGCIGICREVLLTKHPQQ